MKAHLREVLQMVNRQPGVTVDRIEQNKHFKVFLDTPQGKKTLVVSNSVSDRKAILNLRSLVRQWGTIQ